MAYDNNLSGILSRNERRQQPNHPDFSGSCEINGVQFWISAWTKEGKPESKMAGKKFFSLAFKPKDQQATAPAKSDAPAKTPTAPIAAPINDSFDIPF